QKYLRRRSSTRNFSRRACSKVWSALSKGHEVFTEGSKWVAGRNSNLFFLWLDKGTLRSLVHGPLQREEEYLRIKDMVSTAGWDWSKCSFPIPRHILMDIKAAPIPRLANIEDRMAWISSPNGDFDSKDALNVCSAACYGSLGIDWSIIFSIGLWCLWIRRNRVVFQKARPSLNLKVEVLAKATEYVFVGANVHSAPTKSTIQVKWLQPPVNWFKLNSDGSSLGNPGRAGGGVAL
ncbi:hypothetical protein CFP56_016815, partial [Quercus suber]